MQTQLEDRIAQAFELLQRDPCAKDKLSFHHRNVFQHDRALAGKAGSVRVGDIVGRGFESALVRQERTQCDRHRSRKTGHGSLPQFHCRTGCVGAAGTV